MGSISWLGRHAAARTGGRHVVGTCGGSSTNLRPRSSTAVPSRWSSRILGGRSRCQGRFLSSDSVLKERAALLRALQDDGKDEKERANDSPSKARTRTRTSFGNGDKDGRNDTKKKRLTMDEFFANLDTSNSADPFPAGERSNGRQGLNRQGSEGFLSPQTHNHDRPQRPRPPQERGGTPAPRADMGSFFDEVKALMEKNKALQKEPGGSSLNPRSSMAPMGDDMPAVGASSLSHQPQRTGRPSIFDMLPPPAKERSPAAYDEEAFDQYSELLDAAMEGPKFLRRHTKSPLEESAAESVIAWLRAEEPIVKCDLPQLQRALTGGLKSDTPKGKESNSDYDQPVASFRTELLGQRKKFMEHHGWTKKQYNVAVGALVTMGEMCAKRATALPLEIAWQKLKEAGYDMNKDALHNYLYVSSTFSMRSLRRLSSIRSGGSVMDFLDGIGSSSKKDEGRKELHSGEENDPEDEGVDVALEAALCHDILFESTEQSTSIRVRMLVSQGKAQEAEQLLDSSTKSEDLRLRTYAPVFQTYLDQGDVSSAFKLFVKMKHGEHVVLQPETYVQLIACVAENGYFRNGAGAIQGIKDLGYPDDSGPVLFDTLVSELAENAIEINSAAAKRLYNTFQRGFEGDDPRTNLKALHLLESLKGNSDPADPRDLVVSRVRLDENTGRCPRSGAQLRLINLDSNQKRRFRDGLLYLASSSFEERHKTKDARVEKELHKFGTWLKERSGEPFTAILDGPNIAYYMQNFEQGTFNYHQIKFVVDALEDMGENVLVVLPYKYTQDSFLLHKWTGKVRQKLSAKEIDICDDLIARGKAYVVPVGNLDDYYWMYASVSMEGEYIEPGNEEGRWPGARPMLISNDKLRDHQMALLEPRLFRRWYSNFLVNFTFSAFIGDECVDKDIGFRTADFYSREIQGNPTVDDEGNECGTVWHFPVTDWDENESLCIRIPKQ